MPQIMLGDISIDVVHKDIKNLHLSVYPPSGRVRISAPLRMDLETIRVFAISKLSWIRKQQNKLRSQDRETAREYITRESHYFLGRRYLLKVIELDAAPKIVMKHEMIEMYIRPNTGAEKREKILNDWYRHKLKEMIPSIIDGFEKTMNVSVAKFGIKKMKTKWGACNIEAKRIWLNLELAKKPRECIEYIVVHEMAHLLERHHNERFTALMDRFLPLWKSYKDELNRRPLRHENWSY